MALLRPRIVVQALIQDYLNLFPIQILSLQDAFVLLYMTKRSKSKTCMRSDPFMGSDILKLKL